MKKILFGIFAHPDDESFGPAGTLLMEARAGTELHLVTLTNGSAGTNPDNVRDLGLVRLEEWRKAGNQMGATAMHYFGYRDGHLDNTTMIEISQRLITLVTSVLEATNEAASVEFMTLDLNGLTGHIDHIVAARAACHAFYTLKQTYRKASFERIRFFCLSHSSQPHDSIEWIYMEAGRPLDKIGETVDARALRETLISIIHTHHTQRQDGEYHITHLGDQLGINHFIVKR